MTERNVTVRLGLSVRDYISGGTAADAMNRRMTESMRDLGAEADRTAGKLTGAGNAAERSGKRMGRGALYGAAGVAALAAAGGGLKILPPLLAATATAGAALPGILGGAATGAAVLKIALSGVGDALGDIYSTDDPFSRLTPNARKFLAVADQVKPKLLGLQAGLQQRVMQGTAADLKLFTDVTVPAVTAGLERIADDWADTFAELALAAADPQVTGAFNTVAESADRFFDQFNDRIRPTAKAVASLVESADPVARAVGDSLVGMIDRFTARVAVAKRSGSLDELFAGGAEAARDLASITGNVLRLTGQTIAAVNRQGTGFGDMADRLDQYIASGRSIKDITGIVNTLTTAYEGVASVLGPLGALARDAFADPGTMQSIQSTFQILAAGSQVLAEVARLFLALNGATGGMLLTVVALGLIVSKATAGITLMGVAAGKASTRLATMGPAGAQAGRGLNAVAAGAGRALGALIALQVIDDVLGSLQGDLNPQIEAVGSGLVQWAKDGKLAGEAARVLGSDFEDLKVGFAFLADEDSKRRGAVRALQGGLEAIVPGLDGTSTSLTKTGERIVAMDASLAGLVQGGHTAQAAGAFQDLADVLAVDGVSLDEFKAKFPQYAAAMEVATSATGGASAAVSDHSERTRLLAGSFQEASAAGKDLATTMALLNGTSLTAFQAEVALEQAYDAAREAIGKNGRTVNKATGEIDKSTKAGQENALSLAKIVEVSTAAADAANKRAGNEKAGIPILIAAREEFVKLATKATGSAAAAKRLADEIFNIPNKDVQIAAKTEKALAKVEALGFKVKRMPDGRFVIDAGTEAARAKLESLGYRVKTMPDGTVQVIAETEAAKRRIAEARAQLAALNGKTATTYVVTKANYIGPVGPKSPYAKKAQGGVSIPRQHGGVRAAAQGLLQPEIAPPGTRYQWAEPETGGELFLPRRGINMRRGRELLGVAAGWYNGVFLPMARGGVRRAAAGLVNMAPRETPAAPARATRLDYAESYLQARTAVQGLNAALKENGRWFGTSTVKGQENTGALYAAIRAAQDAAKTKFEETGSVKQANAAYAAHIARLRATLQQQKVNSATVRQLLALATRPVYDPPATTPAAPQNSLGAIAWAKSAITAAGGIEDLRDKLSLNRPGISLGTPEGRENLSGIIGFLEQAAAAAQDRYAQSGSAKTATALYNGYVAQLRQALAANGFTPAVVAGILSAYGRITLQPNARGGVYMAARGAMSLSDPTLFPSAGRTLYGFAERGTGGEAFIPRNGEQKRGRELVDTTARWYGGRFTPAGGGGTTSTVINNNLNVTPLSYNPTTAELLGFQKAMDAQARVGRRR
ncbi:MAG TPA: hypothetical protein VF657_13375 [Actinoplanes sp.]|jgi:hypothetical protein